MSGRKNNFPPVVAPDARLLVLGSLPGEASLAAGEYYAHPQNRYWHLMERVIGAELVALPYPERVDTLLRHKVGMWNSVESALREGSLDAAMREVEAADLAALVANLPDLRAVAFNGQASAKVGRPQLAGISVQTITLPSSSPAYAAMPLREKENCWMTLREYLETPGDPAH